MFISRQIIPYELCLVSWKNGATEAGILELVVQ